MIEKLRALDALLAIAGTAETKLRLFQNTLSFVSGKLLLFQNSRSFVPGELLLFWNSRSSTRDLHPHGAFRAIYSCALYPAGLKPGIRTSCCEPRHAGCGCGKAYRSLASTSAAVAENCCYSRIVAVCASPNCCYSGIVAVRFLGADLLVFSALLANVTALLRRYRPFAGNSQARTAALEVLLTLDQPCSEPAMPNASPGRGLVQPRASPVRSSPHPPFPPASISPFPAHES